MTKFLVNNKKTLILVALSLLLIACLIVANYISIFIIKANNKSEEITNPEVEIHMLSLSKSKLEREAKTIAPDFQEIGAGGFIWKNGDYYHVVSSAYLNKNDAELVKNSIKINQNIDSEIFTVKIPTYKINGSFNGEEKKVITKALQVSLTLYTSIYDIAVSVDTGVLNELSAKLSVNSTINSISTTYANFDTLYPNPIESPMKEIKAYLKNIIKVGKSLASDERENSSQVYSSHLKYRYLEAINNYYNFVKQN